MTAPVLTADAWLGAQWSFVLLEGAWAVVTAWSMIAKALARGRG